MSPYLLRIIISIHALRVEGDYFSEMAKMYKNYISIHALRVEGDCVVTGGVSGILGISIHALRVEGDVTLWRDIRLA